MKSKASSLKRLKVKKVLPQFLEKKTEITSIKNEREHHYRFKRH